MTSDKLTLGEKLAGLAAVVIGILIIGLFVKYVLWIVEIINKLVDWIISK